LFVTQPAALSSHFGDNGMYEELFHGL